MSVVDIAIPLGPGSRKDNDELRIFLRSLEEHGRGWRRVLLLTDCAPAWLVEDAQVRVIPAHDRYNTNKDANLFEKMDLALAIAQLAGDVDMVFSADDCAVLQDVDFSMLPPIYNSRGPSHFARPEDGDDWRKWYRRMWHTLRELDMAWGNWDAHVPQRWNVAAARKAIRETPYLRSEGRCIDTAVMGRWFGGAKPEDAIDQDEVKEWAKTAEKAMSLKLDKVFVAYNDGGFLHGLRERLFERFPQPSRWEAQK